MQWATQLRLPRIWVKLLHSKEDTILVSLGIRISKCYGKLSPVGTIELETL